TRPHVVERMGDGLARPLFHRRVVTRWIARELTSMLQNVVLDGTGTLAQIPGYRVAGKTGTAAKPDSRGGYSSSRYVASFVGFVPATRPRIVVLVTVDEPRGAIWGGSVAAPAYPPKTGGIDAAEARSDRGGAQHAGRRPGESLAGSDSRPEEGGTPPADVDDHHERP